MARISHRSNTIHTKVTIILCEVLLYTRCVTPLGKELLLVQLPALLLLAAP